MKIKLIQVGKTEEKYLQEGIGKYEKRLGRYLPYQVLSLPALKNTRTLSHQQQQEKEGLALLESFQAGDYVVLLDEKGRAYSSEDFAAYLGAAMNRAVQQLVFVIGGPYGFSPAVRERAQESLSLSPMTFSHQMVRLFFTEQLYRALSILRNEPYHHG